MKVLLILGLLLLASPSYGEDTMPTATPAAESTPSPVATQSLPPCNEANGFEPCLLRLDPAQRLSERLDALERNTQQSFQQLIQVINGIRDGSIPLATPMPKGKR